MDGPDCEFCGAPLYEARVIRNPVWAVVCGWILLALALCALGLAGILRIVDREFETGDWFEQERYRREARAELEALDRPEWGLVAEFDSTGDLSRETIDALPEPERTEVGAIDHRYESFVQAGEIAGAVLEGSVDILSKLALWFGVPALLTGAYLVSWRRAWRCTECRALA
jgi:hypothetical protein